MTQKHCHLGNTKAAKQNRRGRLWAAALLGILALPGLVLPARFDGAASGDGASLAILNARIWTGNPQQPWAQAVAISGDRILSVGDNEVIRGILQTTTQVFDGGGNAVTPGFIDCHFHIIDVNAAGGYHTLKIYERIHDEMHLPDSRFRIEHAHDVPPDWILLYAKAGVIASIQPPLLSHIDIRTANGAPAPQNLFPCRRLLDAGVKIVMGTDAIGASPLTSTFEVIQTALARPGPDGRVLTLEQYLRAYTLDVAYAEFGEREKGSIEPGKLADLVLLDRDIFISPVSTLDQTKVRMTVLGGRIAYSREDQISH